MRMEMRKVALNKNEGFDIGKVLNWILTIALIVAVVFLAITKWKLGYFDSCELTCEQVYNIMETQCANFGVSSTGNQGVLQWP